MSETTTIEVGSIVYSTTYGEGRVVELCQLYGYEVAKVGFAGRDRLEVVSIVNLSTTKPNEELANAKGYITQLETAIKKALTDIDDISPIEAITRLMVLQRETGL